MNIQDATKSALAVGGYIVRPQWKGIVHIEPTNGPECCILHSKDRAPGLRWNPDAEDLTADDRDVTKEELI